MSESAPKLNNSEAANKNEAPKNLKEMTLEQAQEKINESIERAQEVHAELMEYDRADMYGSEAMDALNETRVLSAQLKETLFYIPATECMSNGLPYHPNDEKFEYPNTAFPEKPDYPLPYEPKSGDGVRVNQEQLAA